MQNKTPWRRKFRAFENGIPVDDIIDRLIRALEPIKMTEYFVNWVNEIRRHQGHEFIVIDGKTLHHSFDAESKNALNSSTARLREPGLVFCQ